ncbi:MAG: c-type cytochrome [Chloroflexi bacterium]|nr:c-type cytochrome [Chloroflexota bacterium]
MKLRHTIILAITTTLLAACNFTLAADVTPPPNYIAPTPAPTLGPLYPASAPDVANGKIIYTEKCAPCHGGTGLGDGPDGKQLPVTVAALGLPETASKASPAKWYTTVTQGNLDRFMPPFVSLSDQERWDVVAYALTLHVSEKDLKRGKELYEYVCGDCPTEIFRNQEWMSSVSNMELAQALHDGTPDIPALESKMTEGGFTELAAYIRTLTFAPPPAPVVDSATETLVPAVAGAGTPSAEGTPLDATAQAQPALSAAEGTPEASVEPVAASAGKVSGLIDNRTGKDFPADLKVTLRGFDHGTDPAAGPQEILTLEGTVNADGTYAFEDVGIVENQIYLAEVEVDGLSYQTEFAVVPAETSELTLPDIIVHSTTEEYSALKVDSVQIYFDFATEDVAQIFAVYNISNTGDKTIIIKMGNEQKVPFIAFPEGAEGLGYEAGQDSAAFVPTADGFAMPPSETAYSLIAFASIPKAKEIAISQPVLLSIGELSLFLPEGVEAEGTALTDEGIQTIQTTNFHVYSASGLKEGESLGFTLTGAPKDNTAVAPDVTQNKNLLIGIGGLGIVLILAGVWMFMRDNKREEESDEEDDEFEDSESIMDAIIAIDELHRAGKLSDEAYKQRREELKDALKRKG